MANPFYIQPANPLQALMMGMQGYETGLKSKRESLTDAARQDAAQALQSGGDPRSALARLIGAGDVQSANALANFGNQALDQQYKMGMLEIARQNANRQETPKELTVLRAAGMDPASPEGRKALFPRTDTPISATDKKAIFEAEDLVPQLKGTQENLRRAKEINDQTFTGYTAGIRGDIGTKLPFGGVLVDKNAALATSEWSKIMGPEALQAMASTLKGATTDFELRKFIEMLADPATDSRVRKGVIERMEKLVERKLELQESRVKNLRSGDYYKPQSPAQPAGQSGGADPLSQARDAIARGAPRDAVIQRLRQNGIDPSGL